MFINKKISLVIPFYLLLFVSCSQQAKLVKTEKGNVQLNKDQKPDSSIQAIINPYKAPLDAEMNDVLIISDAIAIKGDPESTLGNLVADIVLIKTNEKYKAKFNESVDFCLLNKGGLRTSLPKGDITVGKVFELMPFENEIVVLTLSGKKTQEMFDYIAYNKGMPFAGIKMGIRDTGAVNMLVNGKPFDINKNYKIVTSDYLSAGGDKMRFFNKPIAIDTIKYLMRNALIDYMREEGKKGKTLQPKLDGRIYIEQ